VSISKIYPYYNFIIIIINEDISVAFSSKTARTRNTQKEDDMFSRQKKKQESHIQKSLQYSAKALTNL